ncbi:MAG: glycosyltransferase, partial [Pseudomonadota bacterium]
MTYASGITYWEAFLPGVLVLFLAVAVLPWLKRDNDWMRAGVIALCLVVTWRYALWRIGYTIPPVGLTLDFFTGILFVTIETLATIGGTCCLLFLMRSKNRTAEVEQNLPWFRSLDRKPLVDILICTYNEGEDILERTITGALAMDYPNYRLWVCDDGRREWLKELCDRLGCGYITRPDNAHAKAGNINNALRHLDSLPTKPDFISILDADFVPKKSFLERTVALMREPDVGIVQTPQHFFNPDPIQTNLSMERVWPDEQRFFFDVVQPSRDAWGCSFCCGTSSLIRFDALMAIGGFPTDSVTEDYLLTLRLKQSGFRTVYLSEILSVGLAPEGLKEYITQRSRWALGFMQICRGPSSPLRLGNGLSLIDRISLLETFVYWGVTFKFRLIAIAIPILYLLFDIQAVHANVTDAVSYFVPAFAAQVAVIMWISRGRLLPIMSELSQLLCAVEVAKAVPVGLFKSQGHKFKVTAKGRDRGRTSVQWPLLRSFLVLLFLTVAGIAWAFLVDETRPLAASSAIAWGWSLYNIVMLSLACFVAIEAADRRKAERFDVGQPGLLTSQRGTKWHVIGDISATGMRLIGDAPGGIGTRAHLRYQELDLEAVVARIGNGEFAIRFVQSPASRKALIQHIYAGDYNADIKDVRPTR